MTGLGIGSGIRQSDGAGGFAPVGHGRQRAAADQAPWQFLNFLPLPHGHGSLRPTFGVSRRIVTLGNWISSGGVPALPFGPAGADCGACAWACGAGRSLGPTARAVRLSSASMFSNDSRFDALRKSPVQICSRTLFISSSKYL